MRNRLETLFSEWVRRTAFLESSSQVPDDRVLLSQFAQTRNDDAFAALVGRHGPMVLATCRRVTGDSHLADDAFQAAFLVLARRAAVVDPKGLRGWLYGVAVRCSLESLKSMGPGRFRMVYVPQVPDRAESTDVGMNFEEMRILHEEIARLPEYLRVAVVLCELDLTNRKEAAFRLDIPEGTLSSRLAKARRILAQRLRERSIAIPAGGLALVLGYPATAMLPATLAMSATRLGSATAVPTTISQITKGVLYIMFWKKLKAYTLAFGMAAILGLGTAGGLALSGIPQEEEKPAAVAKSLRGADRHIAYVHGDAFSLLNPDGTDEIAIELTGLWLGSAVPSPDGTLVAAWTAAEKRKGGTELRIHQLDGKGNEIHFELPDKISYLSFCWSPKSDQLFLNLGAPGMKGVRHYRADIASQKLETVELLKTHLVTDWSADGKYFLTTSVGEGEFWHPRAMYLMNVDGSERLALADPEGWAKSGKLSPDGKSLICFHKGMPCIIEIEKPKVLVPLKNIPQTAEVVECAWSPDSRRIAYTIASIPFITGIEKSDLKKIETRLVVADSDGSNPQTIRSAKGQLIGRVFWR